MTQTYPVAASLDGLDSNWQEVAHFDFDTAKLAAIAAAGPKIADEKTKLEIRPWIWSLDEDETRVFDDLKQQGAVATIQTRRPDRTLILLAARVPEAKRKLFVSREWAAA